MDNKLIEDFINIEDLSEFLLGFKEDLRNSLGFKEDLRNKIQEALLPYCENTDIPLETVKVTPIGERGYHVNLMRAFKNFPKEEQERIYLEITGLTRKDIKEFIYNEENYIETVELNNSINTIKLEIKIDNKEGKGLK